MYAQRHASMVPNGRQEGHLRLGHRLARALDFHGQQPARRPQQADNVTDAGRAGKAEEPPLALRYHADRSLILAPAIDALQVQPGETGAENIRFANVTHTCSFSAGGPTPKLPMGFPSR